MEHELKASLMTLRIIWVALLGGVVFFSVVVIVMVSQSHPARVGAGRLLPIAGVIGVVGAAVVAAWGVRIVGTRCPGTGETLSPGKYGSVCIVSLAICEGATFFSLVLLFVDPQLYPGLIPPLIGVAGLVSLFPTKGPLVARGGGANPYAPVRRN